MKRFPLNYSLIDVYTAKNTTLDRVVRRNNCVYDKYFNSLGPTGGRIAQGSIFKFFSTLKNNRYLYDTKFYIVSGILKSSILSFVCISDSLFKIVLKIHCSVLFLRVKSNESKIAIRLKRQCCNIIGFEVLCDV